jgi:hypothetical protein
VPSTGERRSFYSSAGITVSLPDDSHVRQPPFFLEGHRESFARTRRQGSQALLKRRLVEKEQNHGWLIGSVLHFYPVPMRDEYRGSRPGIVLVTLQGDAYRTSVDEYDFIFNRDACGSESCFPGGISSVPTTSVFDPVVTGSTLKIKELLSSQQPTITFIRLLHPLERPWALVPWGQVWSPLSPW